MDVSKFDEHISSFKQNQSNLNINDFDLEDITDEDEFCLSEEEADKNDDDLIEIPESILSLDAVFRNRASVLEHLILEDLDNGVLGVSSMEAVCSNDLLSQGAAEIAGNVISEALNKDMDTTPGGTSCPSESELDWNIGNTDRVQCDELLESERQFHLELKALESKLMEEDKRRAVEFQIKREKQQNEEREKEEWKKHRQKDFEDNRIEGTSEPLRIGMRTVDTETEEKGQKELLQQQELICSLQRQMEDERRALEELLKEEKSRTEALRWGSAIRIQAGFRGLLARRRFRIRLHSRREETRRREEEQRRTEMEERHMREMEEERRRREEREKQELQRRKAEYERAKEVERLRLENERKREEERRRKEEEERKTREEEERRIREEEERKRREEEEERIREEEERKRREEQETRIREEKERRMQKEEKLEEDNRKRKDETRKRQEEEKKKMEEKREKEVADEKKHEIINKEQDDKWKEEEERKIQTNFNHQTNKHQHAIRLTDNINLSLSTSQKQSTIHDSIPETVDKGSPAHLHPTTTDPEQMTPDLVPASCNCRSMTLSEQTEQKRLAWMKDCIPWSKLSLQNKRKKKTQQRRRARKASAGDCLPPISSHVLLQHGGWGSLQEVTSVCLENLPDCSLSTLAHCPRLQSLTLRCCGLRALEGLGQCVELRYIDVQDNLITSVDCENLVNLQVLHLSRNGLTSIHGLEGAVNLRVLELSYNFITRIGGLESLQKLQRLCINHNQLISTRELRVVYTLLHLDCSSNHLSTMEGLDSCALLSTLHLKTNNLTEPPVLKNQVLLRELYLEDNNISSLGALTACWLPLLQLLSVAQNSITQLPQLSDFVSLEKLDLSHNCLSEVENVCESLKRCPFLLEVDLTGNPLQQEANWRSSLLKAVPGLRDVAVVSGSSPAPPTGVVLSSTLAEGSFLAFCQAQLQQVNTLAEAQHRELGEAVSPLSAVKVFTRHHEENLQLAEDHRYAHEYGDTTVDPRPSDKSDIQTEQKMDKAHENINRSISECFAAPGAKQPDLREKLHKVSLLSPKEDGNQETTPDMNAQLPRDRPSCSPRTGSSKTDLNVTLSYVKAQYPSATLSEKKPSAWSSTGPIPDPHNLDIKSMAAVVIQRHWRKHRRCRRVPLQDEGGGGKRIGQREKGKGHGGEGAGTGFDARITKKGQCCLDLDSAATVIQASWRGWSLRKKLASALAAARIDAEEDGFEEMDVDEFVFDETLLERDWTSLVLADSPPQSLPLPPQPLYPKSHFLDSYPYQPRLPPDLQWKPKEAWSGAETPLEYIKRGASHHSTSKTKSPASPTGLSGLSERSEKILDEWGFTDSHTALLMLKRAQKMKSKKQRQRRLPDSSVRLALFRNHGNQHVRIEAPEKHSPVKKDYFKSGSEELVEQETEEVKQTRLTQERTYEWLHTQSVDPDQLSESYHFLPQIDPDVLNGGRVQLVAAAGKQGRPLDKAPGSRPYAVSISTPPSKHSQGQTGSLVLSKKNVPSPVRTQSAPSKKERLSFRDNPVQRSGGWGGGKKRDKVQK